MLNTRTFVRTAIGFLALWLAAGPTHADLFVNSSANNKCRSILMCANHRICPIRRESAVRFGDGDIAALCHL